MLSYTPLKTSKAALPANTLRGDIPPKRLPIRGEHNDTSPRGAGQMAFAFETTSGVPPVGGFIRIPFSSTSRGEE